jgi:hypothetical protein
MSLVERVQHGKGSPSYSAGPLERGEIGQPRNISILDHLRDRREADLLVRFGRHWREVTDDRSDFWDVALNRLITRSNREYGAIRNFSCENLDCVKSNIFI